MKTTSTILMCSSLVAIPDVDARDMQTHLKGAVQVQAAAAAASDEFYNLDSDNLLTVETDNYETSSFYKYQFRMDLSTPLSKAYDGTNEIDKCIGWRSGVSPTNYTWYGISFQLPEDSESREGGWNTAPAQPLKEDGYVQIFNRTDLGVAEYNFTTSADRPVIRARVNNDLFWNTFTFDFADGSNYVEHQSTQTVVSCKISESGEGFNYTSRWTFVVDPTMTVSLERLSGPTPAPTPEPSSSSMTGNFFAMTALALASSVSLLL